MTKQQKINDWLDQTPIKNDLFGTQAMERRVIELEFALAVCLAELNEPLAHTHGHLTEDEKWDEEAMIEQARHNLRYRRDHGPEESEEESEEEVSND